MPSLESHENGRKPWRSMAELAGAPEFRALLEAEFPKEADPQGINRRRWLQLMGASLALAGTSGCRWEKEEIMPFAERPERRTAGLPERYATAMDLAGAAIGLLVTAFDGRPIKIEGNPLHPQSLGATDSLAQAAILGLYDPDRSRQVFHRQPGSRETAADWERFEAFCREHFGGLRETKGAGFAVLSDSDSSPTVARLRGQLRNAFPQASWYEYEPLSRDHERLGSIQAFGAAYRTQLRLDRAGVIACFDADLFGDHPAALAAIRQFAERRQPDERMNRLYAIESCYTITGAAADHRLAIRPSEIGGFLNQLEAMVEGAEGQTPPEWKRLLEAIADDLEGHRGGSLLVAGPSQPPEVHAAVHRLNAALDNAGQTIVYTQDPDPERPAHFEALRALVARMERGEVQTLLVLGGNPVYDAPADLAFAAAFSKVATRIHLSQFDDETSQAATWRLPQAHFLEAWGDARGFDGTYSIVQPLIEPLWGGRSKIELLAAIAGMEAPGGYDQVRETFKGLIAGEEFESRWRKCLHDGVLEGSAWPAVTPQLVEKGPASQPPDENRKGEPGGLEIVFQRDARVYDGRFANNGWLQELPDPMTRLTWDNAVLVGPATAERLGLAGEVLVRLTNGGRRIEAPVFIMPGQAEDTLAIALGYGRTAAGQVGGSARLEVKPVGVDAYRLRRCEAPYFDGPATVELLGAVSRLAATQDHHAIDTIALEGKARRLGQLVREATRGEYLAHPEIIAHALHLSGGVKEGELKSLWEEHSHDGYRWGMSIDLAKCIGCGACVTACQAENNIPVVGKERVLEGRQMHWLRVDRYFKGSPEGPSVVHQPVACHHCENAPCEQVCPVAATVHSREGLNDMVYNRCVGTRYCANNCPYKVRRFNFFYYHFNLEKPGNGVLKMAFNPEVTVRSRGVMEKCTYCVQRIQAAKIAAKNEAVASGDPGRRVRDGQVETACQQACPARAIEFGDLDDKKSRVAAAHGSDRAYGMLAELNIKPRTKYLARIRNPHPSLDTSEHDQSGHRD